MITNAGRAGSGDDHSDLALRGVSRQVRNPRERSPDLIGSTFMIADDPLRFSRGDRPRSWVRCRWQGRIPMIISRGGSGRATIRVWAGHGGFGPAASWPERAWLRGRLRSAACWLRPATKLLHRRDCRVFRGQVTLVSITVMRHKS
jgi:hypothetical protein